MKIETLSVDFTDEQKRYLEGFATGLQISKVGRGLGAGAAAGKANAEPSGTDAAHIKAQDKVIASGRKLEDQEKFKREQPPFDAYPRLKQQALTNAPPSPADNFRWRYYGLFYVAPAQDSYMCRLRIPNGILKHWQLAGLADLAERFCGPFTHVTTRANLQIGEIQPKNAVALIEGIQDLGLCSRGSGADNIRNVTGTPTAGIDAQELIDTRPFAREWHFHILNDRSLYGLPRKFNVAFDGAGTIAVLEDTNDIGFQAVGVKDGFGVEPGVWFKLCLGGITGHRDFARDTGVLVQPEDASKVADAVVRLFVEHGDRTDRTKARLKYVLDAMGIEKFVGLLEEKLGRKFDRAVPGALAPRPAFDRIAHIGCSRPEAGGLELDRGRRAGRADVGRADARACRDRARMRRRRSAAYCLAESFALGRSDRKIGAGASADRGARPCDPYQCHPFRPRRLHWQYRLQICRLRHQTPCRRDCALVRNARSTRHAGQYSFDRLSSFLRATFRVRDRAARLQGPGQRRRRSARGLSHPCRRRLRPERGARPRALSRRRRRRGAAHHRAHSQSLSRAPRLDGGIVPHLLAPP